MVSLLEVLPNCFPWWLPLFTFLPTIQGSQLLHSLTNTYLPFFKITDILVGVKWYVIVILHFPDD